MLDARKRASLQKAAAEHHVARAAYHEEAARFHSLLGELMALKAAGAPWAERRVVRVQIGESVARLQDLEPDTTEQGICEAFGVSAQYLTNVRSYYGLSKEFS